jgi:hypothetical protein
MTKKLEDKIEFQSEKNYNTLLNREFEEKEKEDWLNYTKQNIEIVKFLASYPIRWI